MTKKSAIKGIVLTALLLILGIVLAFCRFDIPYTTSTYNGFINSIKMGLDVKGGVTAVYDAKLADESSGQDIDTAIKSTVNRLQSILAERGYTEATITTQSGHRIRVEVPDVDDPQAVFDLIGHPAELSIKKEEDPNAESFIKASDITKVYYSMQNGDHGIVIEFNASGAKKFQQLTKDVSSSDTKQVHIYLGTEKFSTLSVESEITGNSTFISGGSIDSRASAEEYALRIMSGTFSAELSLYESSIVSPTLGMNAIESGLIAGIVGLILIFIFMALPFVQLTLPGIAGIILGIGMAVDANIIIFERIKDEYKRGKRIPASIKSGYRRATAAILDSNITTIMVGIVLFIFGTGAIQGFASTLLISIVVSMISSIFITRWLMKLYLPFNSTKAEKYNLYREEGVNEIA